MDSVAKGSWFFHTCIIFAMLLFMVFPSSGVQVEQEWSRTYGGHYGDGAWSVQVTRDGGYILTGYTSSRGEGSDLWLIKTDSEGNELWNRTFGGSGEDVGTYVALTRDGGYVVTGSTKSYGMGEERLWLLKTDSNGSLQWDRTFGGFVSSSGDGGWAVCETKDGGYIVTGYTKSSGAGGKDLWLLKTDADGNLVWDKTYGGPKDDVGMSVIQAGDGYAVAGRTASFGSGGDDIWLLKVGPDGRELWNTTFGGSLDDTAFQMIAQPDGYIVVGRTQSDSNRAILIKTDLFGRKLWERVYEDGSTGISVQQASDGGFIIGGHLESKESGMDALLIKTDSSGVEEWALRLGGPADDTGTAVVENGGDFVLAGITSSAGAGAEDAWLVKVKEYGDEKDKTLDMQNSAAEKDASNVNFPIKGTFNDSADYAYNASGVALFASEAAAIRAPNKLTEGSGEDKSRRFNSSQRLTDIENIFKQRQRASL
ncbi:MAG TPA: hypothetical protein VLY86_04570 [Methanothrix sp.]|nr:hypothetical protein [Methanothrix sp.]